MFRVAATTPGCAVKSLGNKPSRREAANQQLSEQIWTVFRRSRGTYGSPRIHAELRAVGVECSRNRVARLMRQHSIAARRRPLYKVSTTDSKHSYPVAPILLNRQFSADRPNEKWLTDITYIPTKEGWLYLATVLDVCSRKVVGWATAKPKIRTWTRILWRELCRWPLLTGSPARAYFITRTEAA